ncbi:Presenilin [Balamuthia mandrillaris]
MSSTGGGHRKGGERGDLDQQERRSLLHEGREEEEEEELLAQELEGDHLQMKRMGEEEEAEDVEEDRRGGPSSPNARPREQEEEEEESDWSDEEEEMTLEDQAQMVLAILKPVSITMLLVIIAVRLIHLPSKNFTAVYMVYSESSGDSTSTKLFGSILNALAFVAVIVVVTVIFVLLYKYRCLKVIYAWLIGSSGLMLMMFGGLISYLLLSALNLPFDYVTFSFLLWNFSVVGVITVFWFGPRRLSQTYLILISAFLAIFFTRFPEWTTWSILAAIALYDVFAVLCPRGPLKVLVETAQERQEPIPALLYNGSVFPMVMSASPDEGLLEEDKVNDSVKLGLGDFVFYSVLLGRASLFDWLTVFTCFIAIITGLFATLLLLAVFRKALPALPISIALGIMFFFLTKVFLLPFVLALGTHGVFV